MGEESFFPTDFHGELLQGIPLPVPTSLNSLPRLALPRSDHYTTVRSFERELFQKYSVRPGIYSIWNEIEPFLIKVHDKLIDWLIMELREIDGFDLCKKLYDTLETIYGHMELNRLSKAPEVLLKGQADVPVKGFESWIKISGLSLGIRYLIEMALKYSPHPAIEAGESKRMTLIALSKRIAELDAFMDHLWHNALPHNFVIDENLIGKVQPTDRAEAAMRQWKQDSKPHMFRKERNELAGLSQSLTKPVKESDLTNSILWGYLDKPMQEELGYSLTDWLEFTRGMIGLFGSDERLKVTRKQKLQRHLEKNTRLQPDTIGLLLEDRTLSPELLESVGIREMLPSENFWRDLRVLNRPILQLAHYGKHVIFVGIETLTSSSRVFFDRLGQGKMRFPRAKEGGPIQRSVGALYTNLGNHFRDEVVSACRSRQIEVLTEKANAGNNGIPNGIGPVDVFVIDRKWKRFVLGETKDLTGILQPGDINNQRKDFIGSSEAGDKNDNSFISKLRRQEAWFRVHVADLKREFRINEHEEFAVVGVIITNSPLPWVYVDEEPLPILDDLEFLRRLATGKHLSVGVF